MDKLQRNKELLANLRTILERRGMTQRDLAILVGKKEAEISRWMSGKFNVSRRSQERIEAVLGEPLTADSTFHAVEDEIRIGIVGTGDMADRFLRESRHVKNVRVVAVFNPDFNLADRFCEGRDPLYPCRSYGELLSVTDAVYVASPLPTHYGYARTALENGRHVLCEMPFTETVQEAAELLKLAAKRNLTILPALKTAYCDSFRRMIIMARSGIIGEVVDVSATVTNLLPESTTVEFANERMLENFSYPLLTFLKLFGLKYRHLNAFFKREGNKMLFTHATVEYDNAMGSFKVGIGVKSEGSLVVSGTKGYIYVPAPWWKPDYFEVRFENPADNKKFFFPYEEAGLRYEIQALRDRISRKDAIEYVSREELLKMIEIQNKIV